MVSQNVHTLSRSTEIFNRLRDSHWTWIGPWLLLVSIVFAYPVRQYPVTGGSDVLNHTWIAVEMQRTDAIPLENPYSKTFDVFSFSPLFQISAAQLSDLSGLSVTTVYVIMRLLIAPLYGLGIYCLAWRITKRRTMSLWATVFLFLLPAQHILTVYSINFDIKQANYANLLLFAALWLWAKAFETTRIQWNQFVWPLGIILTTFPLYHQFTAYSVFVLAAAVGLIVLLLRPSYRSIGMVNLVVVGSSVVVAILLAGKNFFRHGSHFLDSVQAPSLADKTATLSPTSVASGLVRAFSEYYPAFTLSLAMIAVVFLIKAVRRGEIGPLQGFLPIAWLATFFFLGLQNLGSFSFFPERFISLSIIPLAILAGFGFSVILSSIPLTRLRIVVLTGALLFTSISATKLVSSVFTTDDISWKQLQTYTALDAFLSDAGQPQVVAEPLLAARIVSLSHAVVAYPFERPDLTTRSTRSHPFVQALLAPGSGQVAKYAQSLSAEYVVVAGIDRRRFIPDGNYQQFDDPRKFRRVFQLYAGTIDELAVYQVL